MNSDNESPFVLEPLRRASGEETPLAVAPPAIARYLAELEGPFQLEGLAEEAFAEEAYAEEAAFAGEEAFAEEAVFQDATPPAPVPAATIRFRTRNVAAAEVTIGGAPGTPTAIAREKYGSETWTDLVTAANPGVDFNSMRPGTKLRVPAAVVPEEAKTPSELSGSTVTMGDPLKVPFGQFTFDAEGNDIPGNKFYSRKPTRPDSASSGVTVGRGFDLGQHNREQIVFALTQAGVSSAYASKLADAAGMKGATAESFKNTFNAEQKDFELTREQQWTLFVWEYMRQANAAARKLARWELARLASGTAIDIATLDVTTIELLVNLAYRGDLNERVWRLLRPAINNRPALAALMQKKSSWSTVPVERYRARCAFLGVEAEQKEVSWELELEAAFEQLAPGSQITTAVGQGRTSSQDDVRRVQARLRQLGMSWVPDSGTIGAARSDPTDHGIRLFRAMLEAEQLWQKKDRSSPCYGTPVGTNRGVIEPGSVQEKWLWSPGAPRWLSTIPALRDGWCSNDKTVEKGCHGDIAEPAMSSWLAEYLDQVGRAFRGKVQAFRPVLAAFASQGITALEQLRSPRLPRVGPLSHAEEEAKRTAAIAQRVAMDVVNLASAAKLDSMRIARETLAAIDGGRAILTVTYLAVPQGGCSTNHIGHQQGLEFDLRLFAHDGPKPGLTWRDVQCSRLLTGLAVDCFLENSLTRQTIYNDPSIRARVGKGLSFDKEKVTTHDNHVHVGIKGSTSHTLIPAPLPAPAPARSGPGPSAELFVASSEQEEEFDLRLDGEDTAGETLETSTIFAMADYISLVRKVEAAYPRWTPDEVLSALRRVAGYDTVLFRILYSTSEANQIKPGDGGLTAGDLRDLEAMSSHRGGVVEKGVAIDPLGQKVAVGHMLCGLSAGEHRNFTFGMWGAWLPGAALQHVMGLSLDNLYATTIAGDLGQSAVLVHMGKRSTLLGPQSEATDAELIGDIDGCVLASSGALGGRRVSDVLSRYYWAAPAAPGDIHAANRFRLFASHLNGTVLKDQTTRFARAFFVKESLRRGSTESVAGEVAQVLNQFRVWYGQKLAAETARQAAVQREQDEVVVQEPRAELHFGEELEGPAAAPGIKTHALRVWNTANADTSVSFSVDEPRASVSITIVTQTPTGPSNNTMVLSNARKAANGSEVTGYAKNQPDGAGGQFTAYLKLQALTSEMVVLVYKNVLGKYVYVPGNDRRYRYQAASSWKALLTFIGSMQLEAAEFELEGEQLAAPDHEGPEGQSSDAGLYIPR